MPPSSITSKQGLTYNVILKAPTGYLVVDIYQSNSGTYPVLFILNEDVVSVVQ